MDSNVSAGEVPEPAIGLFNHFFVTRLEGTPDALFKWRVTSRAEHHMLVYLTEGAVQVTIGDCLYIAQEEEMLVVAAGQVFSIDDSDGDMPRRGYLLQFDEEWLVALYGPQCRVNLDAFEFLDIVGNPRIRFDRMTARWTEGQFEELHFNYNTGWVPKDQRYIARLIVTELHWMSMNYRPLFFRAAEKGRELTRKFRLLMHHNYPNKQNVADYAELLDITTNHLNKVVKETTSRSPARWIDGTILAESKLLLAQTTLSVTEVASKVGIGDASYFSRMFRKHAGRTPGEWRAFWGSEKK